MQIELSSVIYLLGTLLALLFLYSINRKSPLQSVLQKVASVLLLAIAIVLAYYTVILNELYPIYPHIDSLGGAAWMAITPLFYVFNRSLLEPKWTPRWKHLLLFVVPLLFLVEGWITTLGIEFWWYSLAPSAAVFLDWWMIAFFGTSLYFMGRTVQLHRQQPAAQRNRFLYGFTAAFLGMVIAYGILYLFIRNQYMIWFELSMVIWCECFVFVMLYKVFNPLPLRKSLTGSVSNAPAPDANLLTQQAAVLEQVMHEDKPFLDKKLSLAQLAERCNVSEHQLTQLLRVHFNSNFYEYVNRYRLAHVEQLMLDPANAQYKIIALAEDSGFNSKATFYKVFREKHHVTPTEYMKRNAG